ncbi:MAG: hypothetical protein ABUS79_16245 [Pseudomonadota bacterium]
MKMTKAFVARGAVMVVGLALVSSCGSDAARSAGAVGSSCSTDAACSGGLVCLSQICVQPAAAGAGGAGGGGIGDGAAGGGSGMDCTAATTRRAPVGGLISDFSATDGGSDLTRDPFAFPATGPARPIATKTDGALHIIENGPATSAAQYVGVAVAFGGCVDATAFTGIQFSISGSFSGCTMQYATGDPEHQDRTSGAPYATGPSGAYQPQSTLTAAQVTATPQTVRMPFTGATMFGDPQTPLDTTKLVFALWQFDIPAAAPATADGGTPTCVADITIDNLTFY